MAKDITLQSILRTLARLRIIKGVPAGDLATALSPYLKAQHLIEAAAYLETVGSYIYAKQARKNCAECSRPLDVDKFDGRELQLRFVRADACYCSAKCKQKAYRKRVTAVRSPPQSKTSRVTAL